MKINKQLAFICLGILAVSLVGSTLVISEDDISLNVGVIGGGKYLGAKPASQMAIIPVLGVNASGETRVNSASGTGVEFSIAKTPIAEIDSGGTEYLVTGAQPYYPAASVLTPATNLTPTSGARLSAVRNAIATAAPTAVYVFVRPTLSIGKSQSVYNQGVSPLQIIPEDGTVNASGALTPFACTTQKECTCKGYSATQMICTAQ